MSGGQYELDKKRPRHRTSGRVFHIRGLDADNVMQWKAFCARRGYSMVRACESLMRDAAGRRRRIPVAPLSRLANTGMSLNLRQMHPDVLRAFKAYCILFDHSPSYVMGWLMAEAIATDRTLPNSALLPPKKKRR